MSPLAVAMMCLAVLVVWGGLVLSAIHLLRHPDETSGDLGPEPVAQVPQDGGPHRLADAADPTT